MRDRFTPVPRCVGLLLAAIAVFCLLTASAQARADVFGRLHFSVKNAGDEKPLSGAKLVLKDSANTHGDVTLTTDAQGTVTGPQLETRAWQITATADTFQEDVRSVNVVGDTTTEVEILLEPLKEKKIVIRADKSLINKGQTNTTTRIDQDFIKKYPVSSGNPQSLNNVLRSTPGASPDSVNQLHVRDEHSATAIYLDGFYLPGAFQGRAGQILVPENIQAIDILTGAYSPEYGGETAAILNINLRAGSITPLHSFYLDGGSYSTFDGALTLSGQVGRTLGQPDAAGRVAHRLGYFLDFSARRTQNALEAPQPDNQTAHNTGSSLSGFGNFTYEASAKDQFKLTLNSTPAYTQIANRTGLPDRFAASGQQGYGYIGHLTAADAATAGIISQDAAGQDINQRDTNDFGVLNYRHTFDNRLSGLVSLGLTHSGQEIKNNNPAVNPSKLPGDASIEFNPTIIRNNHHVQTQGSLTYTLAKHTFKGGLLSDDQEGDETYQLIPGSQLALNALAANASNLAPLGTAQVDASGNPVLDSVGNQVYLADPNNPNAPVIHVHRSGFYRAAYLQDTWNANKRLTINYGLRLDWYKQSQNLGQATVDQANVSPRLNTAYLINSKTIGRLAYNRLFIQPPLAQGSVVGAAITPETLDQYDANIERQVGPGQTLKIAYFYKEMQNQIDTGLLVPFTQIGVYSSVNFQRGHARGLEISYNLTPKNSVGINTYLTYSHSLNKPTGLQNTGAPVPVYNDHDQLNTLNVGAAYTWRSGANAGLNLYHGSGLASSIIVADANGDGQRTERTQVDLSLSSGPRLFPGGHGGISFSVTNLFDDLSAINFNSGFSGTRFSQGRRYILSLTGTF